MLDKFVKRFHEAGARLSGILLKAVVDASDAAFAIFEPMGLPSAEHSAMAHALFRRLGAGEWAMPRRKFQAQATTLGG